MTSTAQLPTPAADPQNPDQQRKDKLSRRLLSLSARRIAVAGLFILAAAGAGLGQASASEAAPDPVTRLRAATARYHSLNQALNDGFVPTEHCSALPGVGAMGYHYVNPDRLTDGVIDANNPDVLLYAKDQNGQLRLTGVEWFAVDPDQNLSTDSGRPSLFGQSFQGPMPGHEPGMPIHFDLHAWIWQDNPLGTFAPWNPSLTCD